MSYESQNLQPQNRDVNTQNDGLSVTTANLYNLQDYRAMIEQQEADRTNNTAMNQFPVCTFDDPHGETTGEHMPKEPGLKLGESIPKEPGEQEPAEPGESKPKEPGAKVIDGASVQRNADATASTERNGDNQQAERSDNVVQFPFSDMHDQLAAAEILDRKIGLNVNKGDRLTMQELHSAIVSGDSQHFADAIAQYADRPEELRAMIDAVNQTLGRAGSGVRMTVDKLGEKVTIMGMGENAVQISTDGRATVRQVTQYDDGRIAYGNQVHDSSAGGTMRAISHGARFSILYNQLLGERAPR